MHASYVYAVQCTVRAARFPAFTAIASVEREEEAERQRHGWGSRDTRKNMDL